ncbi:GTP cyclohydrolase II [Polyrhizophydium stewartii]|uniref:GTP cyclohydrolase II n=1 Tax=Polyrhizophydium stewartii TaxID=2732419 RepID=A0ABR4N3B8_9FUNG|nr:GTP cyclohydrolase II [Polyrhizophydium stewartii]
MTVVIAAQPATAAAAAAPADKAALAARVPAAAAADERVRVPAPVADEADAADTQSDTGSGLTDSPADRTVAARPSALALAAAARAAAADAATTNTTNTTNTTAAARARILPQVQCQASARIPSTFGGTHRLLIYTNSEDDKEHMALVFGSDIQSASLNAWRPDDSAEARAVRGALPASQPPSTAAAASTSAAAASATTTAAVGAAEQPAAEYDAPLVRIHSCCFTGETVGSLRCDCAEQLQEAMRIMAERGRGVILYLIQEGRGIGLRDKLMAYNLIDMGHDTLSANLALGHRADERSYTVASAMLADLGISSIRLLTNNPNKMNEMAADGVQIAERIPMMPTSWQRRQPGARQGGGKGGDDEQSAASHHAHAHGHGEIQDRDEYLVTKIQKMGHILDIPEAILRGVASAASSSTSASAAFSASTASAITSASRA